MIGVSLSGCMPDLASGRVPYDSVEVVFSGWEFYSEDQWARALQWHAETYWREDNPELCMAFATALKTTGKLSFPKLTGDFVPNQGPGLWFENWEAYEAAFAEAKRCFYAVKEFMKGDNGEKLGLAGRSHKEVGRVAQP